MLIVPSTSVTLIFINSKDSGVTWHIPFQNVSVLLIYHGSYISVIFVKNVFLHLLCLLFMRLFSYNHVCTVISQVLRLCTCFLNFTGHLLEGVFLPGCPVSIIHARTMSSCFCVAVI